MDSDDFLILICCIALVLSFLVLGSLAGKELAYKEYIECKTVKSPPEKCNKWLEVK